MIAKKILVHKYCSPHIYFSTLLAYTNSNLNEMEIKLLYEVDGSRQRVQ